MKGLYYIHCALLLLTGCSSEEADLIQENFTENLYEENFTIDENTAIIMANDFMGKVFPTRSSLEIPQIQYVVDNENQTRAENLLPDTLAYIINYPDNGGFTIMSRDKRVYPILAYSDKGNFSYENEIASDVFISKIKYYLDEKCTGTTTYDADNEIMDGCLSISPMITITLNQRSPYDKYVIKEHPGCPVGCVAVATALIMLHSQETMGYHNVGYHNTNIRAAIAKGLAQGTPTPIIPGLDNNVQTLSPAVPVPILPYSYLSAVDAVAKILYHIGKDVNMTYSTSSSGAFSINAFNLLKKEGFDVVTDYESMNISNVADRIMDNCIVYMRGDGHAWVADGCRFCVNPSTNEKMNTFIHCDWGWGGVSNGYYTGEVFMTSSGPYIPQNYFAVKRNITN